MIKVKLVLLSRKVIFTRFLNFKVSYRSSSRSSYLLQIQVWAWVPQQKRREASNTMEKQLLYCASTALDSVLGLCHAIFEGSAQIFGHEWSVKWWCERQYCQQPSSAYWIWKKFVVIFIVFFFETKDNYIEVVYFQIWKAYFWCKGSMSSLQAARGISVHHPSKTEMIPYSLYSGWHKAPSKSAIPKTVRLMQQAAKSSSISITFFQTTTWTNLIEVTILAII